MRAASSAARSSAIVLARKASPTAASVAARLATREEAVLIGNEVEAMYLNGPAGGGGVTKSVREVIAVASTLIPETLSEPHVALMES